MKRKIKIAVVISSRYRKYSEVCLEIFSKYFNYHDSEIEVNADFFVHTHEKTCDLNFDKTKFSQNLLTQKNIDDINDILKPKKIVIETNYDCINSKLEKYKDNKFVAWCTNEIYNNDFHRLYQYHSFEEGVKLVNKYEIENNINYDLVFKLRPDLFLDIENNRGVVFKHPFNWENSFLELKNNANWSIPYRLTKTLFVHDISMLYGYPKICDTTFFGSSISIKTFAENFTIQILENMLKIYNLYDNKIYLRDALITPENIIVGHIKEKKLNLMPIPFGAYYSAVCIRSNYIQGSNFSQVCDLYNKFWQGERERLINVK